MKTGFRIKWPAVIFNLIVGLMIGTVSGISPVWCAAGSLADGAALPLVKQHIQFDMAFMAIQVEIWEKDIVEGLQAANPFIQQAFNADQKDPEGATYKSADIFRFIRKNCEFDRLIWEFGTEENPDRVHVSFSLARNNRKEVLTERKENGKTVYEKRPKWKD